MDALTRAYLGLGSLVIAALFASLVTPLTSRLARRYGILDRPDTHPGGKKQHSLPVPYFGGVAIFSGWILGATFVLGIPDQSPNLIFGLIGIGAVAVCLSLIGLLDDIRSLPRVLRLVIQIGAALGAWFLGFNVTATTSMPLNVVLTVLWIVGMTNAFNLLDNMDGLSAGLAGVAALSFAVMGYVEGMAVLSIIAAALAGTSFGFLWHNHHPARVFMGDAGSTFLGFLLALIGLELRFQSIPSVTFLVPVIALGLPIFDTSLVVLTRLRHRRPIFQGGRDHVSHRLVRIGLPVRAAVGLLYWAGLCLGYIGLVISRANPQVGLMLLGLVLALGVFFGALIWRLPAYEDASEGPPVVQEPVDLESAYPRPARRIGG